MTEPRLPGADSTARRRVAGVLFAAALVLGTTVGCSDNPEPEPLDQSQAAASSTPSEQPEPSGPPPLPPEARGTSKKSAVAFVEHWVTALNYATRSGDEAAIEQLGASECEVCQIVAERVAKVAQADGSFSGKGWRIRETQYLEGQPQKFPVIRAVIDISPQVVIERAGAKPTRFDGGRVLYTFHLQHVRGEWLVGKLERAT